MVLKTSDLSRFVAGAIIALSFLVQSVTPTGFMPKIGSGKFFEITICRGADQSTIWVDENMRPVKVADTDNQEDKPSHHSKSSKPCVFASVSTKNLTLQSFLFQQADSLTYEEFVERDVYQVQSIDPVHIYFSQGPPPVLLQI